MKVLVTGASGFVGGWLSRALIEQGVDVRVLARRKSDLSRLDGLPFQRAEGDVTDLNQVTSAVQGMDAVFHLAGLIAYRRQDRAAMENVNVTGTANVISACRTHQTPRLVHMSSVVAVGASFDGKVPLTEKSNYNVEHLDLGYFETKRKAELLVLEAVKNGSIESCIVNPSTIYGPGDAVKGSRGVQTKVARGKFPFYTGGGVNVVAVEDVVEGMIRAWKQGKNGERYILANSNMSIKELFGTIASCAGVPAPYIKLPNFLLHSLGKLGDMAEARGKKALVNSENAWTSTLFHWFDSTKAQKELGLKFRSSQEAIEASVRWSRDNGLLKVD